MEHLKTLFDGFVCRYAQASTPQQNVVVIPNTWDCQHPDGRSANRFVVQVMTGRSGHLITVVGDLPKPLVWLCTVTRSPLLWIREHIDELHTIIQMKHETIPEPLLQYYELLFFEPASNQRENTSINGKRVSEDDMVGYYALRHWILNIDVPQANAFPPYGLEFPYCPREEASEVYPSSDMEILTKAYIATRQELARRGLALDALLRTFPSDTQQAMESATAQVDELISFNRLLPSDTLPHELGRSFTSKDAKR